MDGKLSIDLYRTLAREKGGECLSDVYVNCRTKLRWRCAKGHEWEGITSNARNSWCPTCGYRRGGALRREKNFAEANTIAAARGGRYLAAEGCQVTTPSLWKCAEGHEWMANLSNVRRGTWCPECFKGADRKLRSDNRAEAITLATEKGGECLELENFHAKRKSRWRCGEGHEWETELAVVRRGSWCRECANERMRREKVGDNLSRARAVAAAKGWKCLETENFNTNTSIRWECAAGHQWSSRIHNFVINCTKCYQNLSEGFCCDVLQAIFPGYAFPKRKGLPWIPLSDKGRPLELDMYCESLSLAIEYDGIFHFKSFEYIGGEETLARIQEHDRRKDVACDNYHITLIRIPEPEICPPNSGHPSRRMIAERVWEEVRYHHYPEATITLEDLLAQLRV